jgi:hypothetical protein
MKDSRGTPREDHRLTDSCADHIDGNGRLSVGGQSDECHLGRRGARIAKQVVFGSGPVLDLGEEL